MKMDEKNPTLRERMAIVETEVKYINTAVKELKQECTDNFNGMNTRLNSYNETLVGLSSSIDKKLRGSLSGKEKASIIVALITSIGAIVIALVK